VAAQRRMNTTARDVDVPASSLLVVSSTMELRRSCLLAAKTFVEPLDGEVIYGWWEHLGQQDVSE